MIRLETIEDFEKARKILWNPRSEPHQYRVREFGYCLFCREVTQCNQHANMEGHGVVCLKCNRSWYELLGNPGEIYYITYLNIDKMPIESQEWLKKLHSRTMQKAMFKETLRIWLRKRKSQARGLKNEIRRGAKLLSNTSSTLSKESFWALQNLS